MKNRLSYIISTLLALALCFNAGAQSVTKNQFNNTDIGNNVLTFTGNHVTFTFSGSENAPLTFGNKNYINLKQEEGGTSDIEYTLSIHSNEGCNGKITSATVYGYCMHAGTSRNGTMKWEGEDAVKVDATKGVKVSISNLSTESIKLICNRLDKTGMFTTSKVNFFIESINVTYTITPDAPSVSQTTKSINVNETFDVSSCFSVPDNDFTKAYNCSTSGGSFNGSIFSATKAGAYNVYSYITAKDNCHNRSANSSNLVITVNRIAGNIICNNTTVSVKDNKDLASCISSSLGTGNVTYEITSDNSSDASINNGIFCATKSGTYTIKATKAQDDQYNEASTTFTVTVNKKDQEIRWDNEITDFTIINELATNTATATSGLAVTYSSSNPDIIAVDDSSGALTVIAKEGSSVITASQAGNDDFNPAASISRKFTIVEKRQPDFSPDSKFNEQSAALEVNERATITLQNVSDGLEGDFKVTSSSDGVVTWERDGNTLTITARKEGKTTLTLSQAVTSTLAPAETSYAIEVSKIENTLSVTLPSLEAFVDGTIQLEISGKNNTSTDIVETISDVSLSSEVHDGDAVITYSNGVITAKNAGTAKIKFSQEATAEYEGYESATYEITVNKLNNIISISLAGGSATNIKLKYGATASLSYSSENQLNTIAVNRISGSYTTYSAGTITAGNSAGTDIYEITQPETYKYDAGYASISVRVNNTDEMTGYVLNDATQYKHGTGAGVMHTYTLSGPGERIYYTASRDGAAIYYNLYVEYSVNGNDWVEAQDNTNLDSSWKNYSCEIPETARYVRFRFPGGGTLTKYIKDVYVYRKTYVRATVDNANLGSVNTGSTASATISIYYSTTNGGNIALHSDNPHFTIVPASISVSNNSDNAGNPATATLTYTPDPDHLGEETATITVSDLFNSAEITVRATAAKASTSISKNYSDEAAAGLKVDQTIANAFSFSGVSADKPSADTGADFYFTIEHNLSGAGGGEHPTEVVSYDPQSNTISAHNAGRATISIIQKSTSLYSQTSAQFEITVGKWDQTLTWTKAEIETNLQKGQTVSGNTATSDAGVEVTYSSSNTAAITVDPATGELTAVGKGADITITASQAGNYKYAPASITRKFSVFDKKTPVFEPDSHFSENNGRIEIYGTATVSVSGVGSQDEEGGFSIANSDDTVIGVVLDNGVITISALKEGTATLTLEQKGTDDFFAKTASYSIEVFTPGDYIILAPDTEAGTYRRVALGRALPAGYSTISLPFATTLQQLTGRSSDADKVFTLCNVGYSPEGYTFYFTQLEADSTMEAGKPYVLYLESEVANPVWTGEITITDESRVAATVACGGWNFVANFTANFPMDGKYGVVNTTSTIMKGGTNASLGAFTAYFCLAEQDGSNTKAGTGSAVAPSETGSAAAADLPANAIPLFSIKE